MKFPLEMRQCRLKCENGRMNLAAALEFARNGVDPAEGWLLAECPERLFWQKAGRPVSEEELVHCRQLYIFDRRTELRLQKDGADFLMRRVYPAEDGEIGMERLSSCLLRQRQGSLLYGEFFQPDADSGMLEFKFGRFCGVGQGSL